MVWYYKFVPDGPGKITTMIFSEKKAPSSITKDPTVYYIVDPGKTKNSCDPPTRFRPKVIIVTSPDSRHWGDKEFTKLRGTSKGTMRFYPVWTKEELMFARPILRPDMTDKTVEDRFLMFGGVPRHVFEDDDDVALLRNQNNAVKLLAADQANSVAYAPEDLVFDYFSSTTQSALLAIQLQDDDGSFRNAMLTFVSSLAYRKASEKFLALLWNVMLSRIDGGLVFEEYCCRVMRGEAMNFTVRNCVGKTDPEYKMYSLLTLGGCKETRQVNDPVSAYLFRPLNSSYPLIYFLYTNATGHFHAFQDTISPKHEAKSEGGIKQDAPKEGW
jgi:hypothetical protein